MASAIPTKQRGIRKVVPCLHRDDVMDLLEKLSSEKLEDDQDRYGGHPRIFAFDHEDGITVMVDGFVITGYRKKLISRLQRER